MKDKIIKAIELYASEPFDNVLMIRAVPDPEVLADFILEAIKTDI